MCTTCGCGEGETRFDGKAHAHEHVHADGTVHSHGHAHEHGPAPRPAAPGQRRVVSLEQSVLAKNNAFAADNRALFRERGILALNLVSSPGSGKTTLLVETLKRLGGRWPAAVIEGDQQTSFDADRIRETGVPALQVNTGKGCHLDAHKIGRAHV